VLEDLFFEGSHWAPYLWRHFALMALSTSIATFGLINNSGAVVIGAMLVAPLMTPIMAFAAATVMAWPKRQLRTALIVVISALFAIAIAWGWEALIRDNELTISDELLARTAPNLFDLGIAVFAGAAGAYVSVRRQALGALPGVAVAVALVPPLATVGVMLARREGALAEGALLLFMTNLAAIVVSAAVVLMLTRFVPRGHSLRSRRSTQVGLAVALVGLLAVTIPLVRHTHQQFHEANARAELTAGIGTWLGDRRLDVASLDITERDERGDWEVLVRLVGPDPPPAAGLLSQGIADRVGRPGSVRVQWLRADQEEASAAPERGAPGAKR
jgi:uncharacterized hydrophobic protein (TIGR00271 family)